MITRQRAPLRPMEFAEHRYFQGLYMLRPYQPHDEAFLDLREDFLHAFDAAGQVLPPGLRWTLTKLVNHEHRPVVVGGLEPLGPARFGAWALASDLGPRGWSVARTCAGRVLDWAERELGARHISAMAADTPGAIALLESLRFEWRSRYLAPDGATYLHMTRSF